MPKNDSLFLKRKKRESELLPEVPLLRESNFLSGNTKTGYSLNFPILNCTPSKTCINYCYACQGPIAFKASVIKALSIEKTLKSNLHYAVVKITQEIQKLGLNNLRYSGGGELSRHGIKLILELADSLPNIIFWGFTKKIDVARALHKKRKNVKVIFSLDSSTSEKILTEVKKKKWKTSWLYDNKNNKIPQNTWVVFANHSGGSVDKNLPIQKNECLSIRNHSTTCNSCRYCFNFK